MATIEAASWWPRLTSTRPAMKKAAVMTLETTIADTS